MNTRSEKSAALAALPGLIERLTDVLDRENRALAARDHRGVHALLPEKRAAIDAYEDAVRTLADPPSSPAEAGAGGRSSVTAAAALRLTAGRLARIAAENRRRLSAAIEAHKQLLGLFATAARECSPAAGRYARDGAKARSGFGSPAPTAFSLDRAL